MCVSLSHTSVQKPVKRIFFIAGEKGIGKSTFLKALIKKFALQPSGFITRKEETENQAFLYLHPVFNGSVTIRRTAENRAGVCTASHPIGFPEIFDSYGCTVLHRAVAIIEHADKDNPEQYPIIMDELGAMEKDALLFCREVCRVFDSCSVIGAVKPKGTMFLPILENMPNATVFRLTIENRKTLYRHLGEAQSFEEFLYAVC